MKTSSNVKETSTEFGNYFECADKLARIHPVLVCDGHSHCEDGSDEDQCLECPRNNEMIVHGQVRILLKNKKSIRYHLI